MFALFGIIARVIMGFAPLWIVILVLSFLSWVMFGGPERQATVQNFGKHGFRYQIDCA